MTFRTKEVLKGFIPSLILPLVFISIFIFFKYQNTLAVIEVIKELLRMNQLSAVLAVGAVPNLALFFYAMKSERWQLGRGVLSATLMYGTVVMMLRL